MALGMHSPAIPHYPRGYPNKVSNLSIRCFGNRFRVASAFKTVQFKSGMSRDTGKGYSDLIHVTLAYSAYEQFRQAFGLGRHPRRQGIEDKYRNDIDYLAIQSGLEKCKRMLARLCKCAEIKESLVQNIKQLRANEGFSVFLLAEAIRHGFVHGELTPNAFKAEPKDVSELSAAVARLTIKIMDSEFEDLYKKWKIGQEKIAERQQSHD